MGPSPNATYQILSHKVIGPLVLEKKILEGVFTIYGRVGHLGHVPGPGKYFHSPLPLRHHMKFGFDWPSVFGEDDGGWMDDGPWLYYKLTMSWANKAYLYILEDGYFSW